MRRQWRTFFAAWAVLSVLAIAWSIATPLSAAPDEPAHIVKAASVVRGQFVGKATPTGHIVQVPRYIAYSHNQACTAFHLELNASCLTETTGDPAELVDSITTAGLYNPVYYLLIGWPSLVFHDSSGIHAMRIVSALLSSVFLAAAFTLVAGWRRRALPLLGLAAAVTPMVLFLNGTINPNALEIATVTAAAVAMLSIVTAPDRARLTLPLIVLGVSFAIGVNARGLSPLWLAIAVLVPLLLLSWRQIVALFTRRDVQIVAAAAVLAGLFAIGWLVGSNSLGAGIGPDAAKPEYPYVGSPPIVGFFVTLDLTFDFASQMIGLFGWLDTPPPTVVFFIWSAVIGAFLLAAMVVLRGRRLLVVGVLVAALVLVPAGLQSVYVTSGGIIWQGRYVLPVFTTLLVTTGALLAHVLPPISPARLVVLCRIVFGALMIGQFMSFAGALRRYAVGAEGGWVALVRAPQWSPPGGVLLSLGVFAVGCAVAWWLLQRMASEHVGTDVGRLAVE